MIFFLIASCKKVSDVTLKEGLWLAELRVMDNAILPFNFRLTQNANGSYEMQIINADEKINVDEIRINGDSIYIQMPVFEGYLSGVFKPGKINGSFIIESLEREVVFEANHNKTERFEVLKPGQVNISGIWETKFSPNTEDQYMGKGIFVQDENKVTGTFRTTTGDYRFLDGVLDGDSLKLSAFDGAHAFLFKAKVSDSTLQGTFYSGSHFKEPFSAIRNESYELPSPDSLTFLKDGYTQLEFSFPDENNKMVSLKDEIFKNKVVIVQIMGTWCPNCLDETKFLNNYVNENPNLQLQVVGLAFESAKTKEKAMQRINKLKTRIAVNYPILLAQYGTYDKQKAQEKLPMLDHILSYPTTLVIDKKGVVRKIHTGFNGPATGEVYEEFKNEFDALVKTLEAE